MKFVLLGGLLLCAVVFVCDWFLSSAGIGFQGKLKDRFVWSQASRSSIIKDMGHFHIESSAIKDFQSETLPERLTFEKWASVMNANEFTIRDALKPCEELNEKVHIIQSLEVPLKSCASAERMISVQSALIATRKCFRNYVVLSVFENGQLLRNTAFKETHSGCHY